MDNQNKGLGATAARVITVVALALLAGCGTSPKMLENRVVCTIDRSEAHVLSKWGPVSLGTQVSQADAAVVCAPAVKPGT